MGRKPRDYGQGRLKGEQRTRPSRRRRWWLVGLALAVLVVAGGVGAWFWNGAQAAREIAPKFNLIASTGRVITTEDFLGKQDVVLIFYMGAG